MSKNVTVKEALISFINEDVLNYYTLLKRFPKFNNNEDLFKAALNSKVKCLFPLLEIAGPNILKNESLVLEAIKQNSDSIRYVDFNLVKDIKEFIKKVFLIDPKCLEMLRDMDNLKIILEELKPSLRIGSFNSLDYAWVYFHLYEEAKNDYEYMKYLMLGVDSPKIELIALMNFASSAVTAKLKNDEEVCRHFVSLDLDNVFDFNMNIAIKVLDSMGLEIRRGKLWKKPGTTIDDNVCLFLSNRTYSFLKKNGIYTLEELANVEVVGRTLRDYSDELKEVKRRINREVIFFAPKEQRDESSLNDLQKAYMEELLKIIFGGFDTQTREYLMDELDSRYDLEQEKNMIDLAMNKRLVLLKNK